MKSMSLLRLCAALLLFYPAFPVHAQNGPVPDVVPEIDPSMAAGGIALVSCVVLMQRKRKPRA